MDFVQAIKSCLGQYATFSGRASRSEYWWFFLFQVLVMVATGMLGDVINGLASLALLLPALAVGTRRLHDIGRTGWWQLLLLTGIGFFVLLYWWVQPTDGAPTSTANSLPHDMKKPAGHKVCGLFLWCLGCHAERHGHWATAPGCAPGRITP
jgi:hypothetical protein